MTYTARLYAKLLRLIKLIHFFLSETKAFQQINPEETNIYSSFLILDLIASTPHAVMID